MKNLLLFSFIFSCSFIGCKSSEMAPDLVARVEGTYKINEILANGRQLPQTEARLDIVRINKLLDRAYFTVYFSSTRLATPTDTFNAITYKVTLRSVKDSVFFYGSNGTVKFAAWGNNLVNCEPLVDRPSDPSLSFNTVK